MPSIFGSASAAAVTALYLHPAADIQSGSLPPGSFVREIPTRPQQNSSPGVPAGEVAYMEGIKAERRRHVRLTAANSPIIQSMTNSAFNFRQHDVIVDTARLIYNIQSAIAYTVQCLIENGIHTL
ncbi:hypothetical protein QTP88_015752 [Uroleucon formosanum]